MAISFEVSKHVDGQLCIQMKSTYPDDCFKMGRVYADIITLGGGEISDIVQGDWGQGKFIRIPLAGKAKED